MFAFLNRSLPLLLSAVAILALIKFLSDDAVKLGDGIGAASGFVQAWWWAFLAFASLLWLVVFLGWLTARGRLPGWIARRRRLVDILNRLTNRAALEARLQESAEEVFISAPALSEAR